MTGPDKPAQTAAGTSIQPHPPEVRGAESQDALPQPDPRMLHIMKAIVIILGVLIVLALIALVAGIIMKGAALRQTGGAAQVTEIPVPPGTAIQSMSSARGELAVALRHPDGRQEIVVIDTQRGRILRRIRLVPAQ